MEEKLFFNELFLFQSVSVALGNIFGEFTPAVLVVKYSVSDRTVLSKLEVNK